MEVYPKERLVKIVFDLDPDDWHGAPSESVWAAQIDTSEGPVFEIRNSPWYMNGISYLDCVRATPLPEAQDVLQFESVASRGGHSTYWLLVKPGEARFDARWNELRTIGCTYESGTIKLAEGAHREYSVDVPPNTDIHEVYALLELGEAEGVWQFAEGHCGHDVDRTHAKMREN